MLNKFIFGAMFFALSISAVFAQTTDDDYKKNEFYVGYSHQRGEHTWLNGGEFAAVRNFNRYFGIKGDVSVAARNREFTANIDTGGVIAQGTFRSNIQIYNFLGGVQIKDNRTKSRFKPFAHALVGVGVGRFNYSEVNCSRTTPNNAVCTSRQSNDTRAGFAGAFGGGLDIKVNDQIDFRAVQVDYNPVYFDPGFRNNVRFGIGIVFK